MAWPGWRGYGWGWPSDFKAFLYAADRAMRAAVTIILRMDSAKLLIAMVRSCPMAGHRYI